jgi:DNA-nicking Smr family endonuclease
VTAGRKESGDGERFADLLGDARPLKGKSARRAHDAAPRPKPGAARAGRDTDPESRGASTAPPESGFRWPEPGNRHRAAAAGANDALLIRLARGEPEPEEKIDLHGTRAAEARRLLATRIESAQTRGLRCVLVVHGRGQRSPTNEAVLRDAVPDWLTRGATGRRVLAFAPAPKRLGGEGATIVSLRKGGDR